MPLLTVSWTPAASSSTLGWELTSVKKLKTTGSSCPGTVTGSVTIHDPLLQRRNFLHLKLQLGSTQPLTAYVHVQTYVCALQTLSIATC